MEKHVVLGANGGVGKQLIQHLLKAKKSVRAVSRSISLDDVECLQADVSKREEAEEAVRGCSHVYLTLGLAYDHKVWGRQWPIIMDNCLHACDKQGAKLIFLDNVYMYGPPPLSKPFTEEHEQHPTSRKGKVRKAIADALLDAAESGRVKALIARSADFFGPDATNSIFYVSFLENLLKGKSPLSLFPTHVPHTFANTIDIAEGLYRLGTTEDAWGKVWHLPVGEPVTIAQMADTFNQLLGTDKDVQRAPGVLKFLLGLFIPAVRELKEMDYQFSQPYIMDWSRFAQRFPDFRPCTYEEAAREMIKSFR